jgi:predicted negative regulator of RcsB-dependent stress response
MAVYDLEEQERIDALKDWWEANRAVVIGVVALVVLAIGGYFGWNAYRAQQLVKAEELHKEFIKALDARDTGKVVAAASQLTSQVGDSFHATSAALASAKTAFDAKDFATARQQLEWASQKGQAVLRPIAGLRLTQVLLEEKKFDEALKVLDGIKDDSYQALVADTRGDVLMAKGSKDEARMAWQTAVEKAGERSAIKQAAQIKLDAVGGVSK